MMWFYGFKKYWIHWKNKPAIDEDIHLVNNQIKGILPDVYKEFLKITNGAVLNGYVFYSTKEMIEMYKCHDFF